MIYTVGNPTHIRITFIDALLLRLIGNDRRIGHEIHIRENYRDHRVHLGIHVLKHEESEQEGSAIGAPFASGGGGAPVTEHFIQSFQRLLRTPCEKCYLQGLDRLPKSN
jgi:hypothetical protein